MKIVQILGVAVIGVSFAMVIRPYRPELSLIAAIVTSLVILLYFMSDLGKLIDDLAAMAESYSVDMDIIAVLLKITGIAYLAQIGARICADAGESAIASKVEMCGRILILGAALPQLAAALSTATELLGLLTQ